MTLLKFEIGTFCTHAQYKNLVITWWCLMINVISSNLGAKFRKRYWVELRPGVVSSPIIPSVYLNVYESGNQVFFSFAVFFLIMWNHLDIFCNHLVFTGSYPFIYLEGCQLTWIQFLKKLVSILPNFS